MAKGLLNIQSDEFVTIANRLQKIGRADMPVAVRSTLNQLAFNMKGGSGKRGEIDKQAESSFDSRRNKSLFKAMTGFDKAKGLDIGRMKSEAGIINRSGKNKVAEGLADQETGTKIKQKATPLTRARVSSSIHKKVRSKFLLNRIDEAYKIKRQRGKKFVSLALRAHRTGRPVLITGKRGDYFLAFVRGFNRTNGGGIRFDLEWRYRFNRTGSIDTSRKRPFVSKAADKVFGEMPKEFRKQAKKRIEKSLR